MSDLPARYECSFCNKSSEVVRKLIAGPSCYICNECVEVCVDILSDDARQEEASRRTTSDTQLQDLLTALESAVVGHAEAKRVFAVAVRDHYLSLRDNGNQTDTAASHRRRGLKGAIVLAGPTGVGKSHLVRSAAEAFGVPFAAIDAIRLKTSSYARKEDVFGRLLNAAGGNTQRAGTGIVLIEGIDQLSRASSQPHADATTQAALVSMMTSETVGLPGSTQIELTPSNILFVYTGTFGGLKGTTTKDLAELGFIPEFASRLTTWIELSPLSEDDLVAVLQHKRVSPLLEYHRLFEAQGVRLVFDDEAVRATAREAMKREAGARGLQVILRRLALELALRIASTPGMREILVSGNDVRK